MKKAEEQRARDDLKQEIGRRIDGKIPCYKSVVEELSKLRSERLAQDGGNPVLASMLEDYDPAVEFGLFLQSPSRGAGTDRFDDALNKLWIWVKLDDVNSFRLEQHHELLYQTRASLMLAEAGKIPAEYIDQLGSLAQMADKSRSLFMKLDRLAGELARQSFSRKVSYVAIALVLAGFAVMLFLVQKIDYALSPEAGLAGPVVENSRESNPPVPENATVQGPVRQSDQEDTKIELARLETELDDLKERFKKFEQKKERQPATKAVPRRSSNEKKRSQKRVLPRTESAGKPTTRSSDYGLGETAKKTKAPPLELYREVPKKERESRKVIGTEQDRTQTEQKDDLDYKGSNEALNALIEQAIRQKLQEFAKNTKRQTEENGERLDELIKQHEKSRQAFQKALDDTNRRRR